MIFYDIVDPVARILGEWSQNINGWSVLFRLGIATILSAFIGWERSNKRHAAGLRTFILAIISSTTAMLLDLYFNNINGTSLFILSGCSVLALGILSYNTTLYTSKSQIKGLTTSVALWATGFIGLSLGAGMYLLTIILFSTLILSLSLFPMLETYLKNRSNHFEVHLELTSATYLKDFVTVLRELGLKIDDIEANPAYLNSGLSVYSVSLSITKEELQKYKTHKEIIEALNSLPYVAYIEETI